MGGLIEVFPPWLLTRDRLNDVIIFLRELPVEPKRKKQALVAWTRYVGVALTYEMVEAVLGPYAEKYRG